MIRMIRTNKIIWLDAGHGGDAPSGDPGAMNGSRREADDTLDMALELKEQFENQGFTVLMTRTTDEFVSLQERTKRANAAKADLFISLHRNSFTNSTANGVEIWVYTTAGSSDVTAATEVLFELDEVGIQSNRGVKKGNYHVLRESAMASMLIELGFISNSIDNKLFDENLTEYMAAIVKGVCTYFGETYDDYSEIEGDIDETEVSHTNWYKVQVGAFTVKSNAEAFLENVKSMGLKAFMVQESADIVE